MAVSDAYAVGNTATASDAYAIGRGWQRRLYHYRDMMTPFDKLASLPGIEQHLKPGISLAALHTQARAQSDSEAAGSLNRARTALFEQIFTPRKSA
jgi:hypothetical protein